MFNYQQKNCNLKQNGNRFCFVLMIVVPVIFSLIVSCNSEEKDWELTQSKKTLEEYEKFYKKYPESKFALKALDTIWMLTKEENNIDSYEKFLHNHPHTSHAPEALDEIWRLTEEKNTMEGYDDFLMNHPDVSLSNKAKTRLKILWTSLTPKAPVYTIESNLTVDLEWSITPGASSYIVYWAQQKNFSKNRKNSITTTFGHINHKLRVGRYSAKLPMYYRISAVRDGVESKLSEACFAHLLPHKGGKYCQICGEHSVGYCHLREIYVCSRHDTFTDDGGTNWQCP